MNKEAREFILGLNKETRKFKLAFSFKANKTNVITDSVYIIYKKEPNDIILYLLDKFTTSETIKNWVMSLYNPTKIIIFSFLKGRRKIYIERSSNSAKSQYFSYSIEWKLGKEDEFEKKHYNWESRNSDCYKELISPELFDYLDFSRCLVKNDKQVYIKHNSNRELTLRLISSLMKTLLNLQDELDDISKHENLVILRKWLNLHCERKALFSLFQISESSMNIYVY